MLSPIRFIDGNATAMSRIDSMVCPTGEAVDVTGWLGGYNFQWAWSSGWAAGTAIAAG